MNIRFGGTTEELISEQENWDLAIVSSCDVDLKKTEDKSLVDGVGNCPFFAASLHQWHLSDD